MKIGIIGLGKMGKGLALQLHEKGHDVIGYNRSEEPRRELESNGITTFDNVQLLIGNLTAGERVIWLMIPHTAVDEALDELLPQLAEGDIIIDGGNSFYKDTIRRAEKVSERGVTLIDAGVSGGPEGARNGACIMIGGPKDKFEKIEQIFKDLTSDTTCYQYLGKTGAGHFVKMVHNGIEYGMMQAIAEGFSVLKNSEFDIDVTDVARIYNCRSVVESRLIGWLEEGYLKYGAELEEISGSVGHTGEGEWTVEEAKRMGIDAPVIKEAYNFRVNSAESPSYTGKVLSVLRNMFGGHKVEE